MDDRRKATKVEDVFTDDQVSHIVKQCVGDSNWKLVSCELKPAAEGLGGFLGDHFRLTLKVKVADQLKTFPLFVKSVPLDNASKIEFIAHNRFFTREITILKLIEEMETGPNPFATKLLFSNEKFLVMPDLALDGYTTHELLKTLDLPHVLVALTSVARFHAATANLETKRGLALQRPYSLMEEHGHIIDERNFRDSPWIRAAAKLTSNIIHRLSNKYKDAIPDSEREPRVVSQFLAGCDDVTESTDSLNLILHRDLWVSNIMFKYENDAPTNVILVDFQLVRYGPPAFDVTMLLYMTTSRIFRQQHEAAVFQHYFRVFTESLSSETKLRLKALGYDYEEFLRWVEVSRRFGMVGALVLFPLVLMDSVTASAVFDDPATFQRVMYEDRTDVVLEYAQRCPQYGERQLEVTEEFVERCLLSK